MFSAVTKSPNCAQQALLKLDENSEMRAHFKQLKELANKVHNQEVDFYRMFGQKAESIGFPLPKIYFTSKCVENVQTEGIPSPMLLMEDLKTMAIEFPHFNLDQAKQIVLHLANLHKHVIALEGDDWKSALGPRRHFFPFPDKQHILMELNKMDHEQMGELGDTVVHLRQLVTEDFLEQAHRELLGLPCVLVHGDLNPGNVFFSRQEPSEVYAFIDFQSASLGNIAYDLERVFFATRNNNGDQLDVNEQFQLLDFYYNALGSHKIISITMANLHYAYRTCKLIAALFSVRMYTNALNANSPNALELCQMFLKTAKTVCTDAILIINKNTDT